MQPVAIKRQKNILLLILTIAADAGNDHVPEISVEVVFGRKFVLQGGEDIFRALNSFTAAAAAQVVMVPLVVMVVNEVIAYLAFIDAARLFQDIQRAVDGGFVDAGHARVDALNDLTGSQVALDVMDDIRNQYPLRGEPEAFLF
jgi:hypothetical protein